MTDCLETWYETNSEASAPIASQVQSARSGRRPGADDSSAEWITLLEVGGNGWPFAHGHGRRMLAHDSPPVLPELPCARVVSRRRRALADCCRRRSAARHRSV